MAKLMVLRHKTPPRGAFRGNNFMTPKIEEYGEIRGENVSVYYEISTGRGISNQPIAGVTIRDAKGDDVPDLPSRMVQGGARQAFDCIEALVEEFNDKLATNHGGGC